MNNILIIDTFAQKMHMEIYLPNFFPASKKDIQKLVKMNIHRCENQKELLDQCVEYLNHAIQEAKEDWKNASNRYVGIHQDYADVRSLIESGKHPNGVRIDFDEMKRLEKDFKHLKSEDKSRLSELKKAKKTYEKYVMNLEFINKKFR